MKLHKNITLSLKHGKSLRVFPYFFIPALNNFYFLKTELGFFKPVLETWKHEGYVKFASRDMEVIIEFDFASWIGICFRKPNSHQKIYLEDLLKRLDIPFDVDISRISKTDDLENLEAQINLSLQKSRDVIKNRWDEILKFVKIYL